MMLPTNCRTRPHVTHAKVMVKQNTPIIVAKKGSSVPEAIAIMIRPNKAETAPNRNFATGLSPSLIFFTATRYIAVPKP